MTWNRTILELKLNSIEQGLYNIVAWNRTILELKLFEPIDICLMLRLGIAPFWN